MGLQFNTCSLDRRACCAYLLACVKQCSANALYSAVASSAPMLLASRLFTLPGTGKRAKTPTAHAGIVLTRTELGQSQGRLAYCTVVCDSKAGYDSSVRAAA